MTHRDWSETTEVLIQDQKILEVWRETIEHEKAFEEWATKNYPEEYGND